jgi:hypothetical protein
MIVQPVSRQLTRAALAAITFVLLQASGTVSAAAITVPDNLQPAASTTLALEAHAVGVQIYTCAGAKADAAAPAWTLKAPDAILSDASGAQVAKHYAGPTWEAPDGSKAVGQAKASATPSPDAIPWLLLDVKSTSGNGIFSKITAVQRVATEAGKAPQDGCTVASVGQEVRVPYQAVYRFYTNK